MRLSTAHSWPGWTKRSTRARIGAGAASAVLALAAAPLLPAQAQPAPAAAAAAPSAAARSSAQAPDASPISRALVLREAGRHGEALALLQAHLRQSPHDARAWAEVGLLYAVHGQLEDARAALEAALRLAPGDAAILHNLAEVLRSDGRFAAALPHYAALAASGDAAALRGQALCLLGLARRAEAKTVLTALASRADAGPLSQWAQEQLARLASAGDGTTDADVLAADAERERLLAAGSSRAAADLGVGLCHQAPTPDRCHRAAVAALAARDYLAAVGALRAALRLRPDHLPALSAWPTALRKLRSEGLGGAPVGFQIDAGEAAGTAEVRARRALLAGDWLVAERIAATAIAAGKAGVVLLLCRAEALLRLGDGRGARIAFEALATRRPSLDLARSGIAAAAWSEGLVDLARQAAALPPRIELPVGVELPDGFDADADLRAAVLHHRDEVDRRLAMGLDPGRRPGQPSRVRQTIDVEALRVVPAPSAPPAAPRGTPRRR